MSNMRIKKVNEALLRVGEAKMCGVFVAKKKGDEKVSGEMPWDLQKKGPNFVPHNVTPSYTVRFRSLSSQLLTYRLIKDE